MTRGAPEGRGRPARGPEAPPGAAHYGRGRGPPRRQAAPPQSCLGVRGQEGRGEQGKEEMGRRGEEQCGQRRLEAFVRGLGVSR